MVAEKMAQIEKEKAIMEKVDRIFETIILTTLFSLVTVLTIML